MTKRPALVRYISPFGSPAWMTEEEARGHLVADARFWEELSRIALLSAREREIGPPRIERT